MEDEPGHHPECPPRTDVRLPIYLPDTQKRNKEKKEEKKGMASELKNASILTKKEMTAGIKATVVFKRDDGTFKLYKNTLVKLSLDCKRLHFKTVKKLMCPSVEHEVFMAEITDMHFGKQTRSFLVPVARKLNKDLCVSIVTKASTLDFEGSSVGQVLNWVQTLSKLLTAGTGKSTSVDSHWGGMKGV